MAVQHIPTSILEYFKSVCPCEPLPRSQTSDVDGGASPHISTSSSSSVLHPNVTDHSSVESATPFSSSSGLSHCNLTPQSSKVSPLSGCSSSSSNKSIISKFLPSLPAVTPSRSSSVTQSRAWVLTSKECLEHLEEKEKKETAGQGRKGKKKA